MIKAAKYSHLSTKIRAMIGRMLTDEDYEKMLQLKDVKSVVLYLKNNTYYRVALETLNEQEIHRGHVEVLLYRAEITDALKISRYLSGNEKKIFRFVYRKQEIEDIKKMLRILQRGASLDTLDRKRLFISKNSRIDFNKALSAKTITELVKSISNTRFYEILLPLILEENSIDLFAAEMALDLYYFAMIKEQVKTLAHGKDREILKGFFGSEADIKNIMWIYRGRHYYKLSKEIIYRYLIPYGNRIKMTFIDALIEAPDEERLVELIRSSPYNQVFDENPVRWELAFMRSFLQKQLNNLRIYPFSLAPIIGYIYAKESEISNITTIIEGVRYEVSPDTMKTDLIIKV
ncbi:MAG: V-type ATPase subunit [Vallitaleaceae bacterium]|jgi:V/A-type H+-transporting ATPase subunit C|nr:V-type ATPase subunit [Vallitaleaceae bacterium]